MFFETSSKTGSNVKTLFNELAKKLTGVEVNLIESKNDGGGTGFQLDDIPVDPDAKPDG